jgi:hypothetical protein
MGLKNVKTAPFPRKTVTNGSSPLAPQIEAFPMMKKESLSLSLSLARSQNTTSA